MADEAVGTTNETADGLMAGIQDEKKPNNMEILEDLDDPNNRINSEQGFFVHTDPDDPDCGKWGREQMKILKSAALSSKTVYAYCFVQPTKIGISTISAFCLVFISVVIQIVIPLGIIILLQPVQKIDGTTTDKLCPNRSDAFTKFLAFCLSAYFVVLTLGLCTNKLRGLLFLKQFVTLTAMRETCITFGILVQCFGILVASLCQYLLFIGNGDNYVVLLLQSLAMQFCLTVDKNIVSHQIGTWTAQRLELITDDKCLASKHGGLENPDGTMPANTLRCLQDMVNSENVVLVVFVLIGIFFSGALAVCM